MPGEDNVQAPLTQNTAISSDDIEPPTEITDPKLKKKIRSNDSGIESASGEDDDDDEPRGRPRTAAHQVEVEALEGTRLSEVSTRYQGAATRISYSWEISSIAVILAWKPSLCSCA